MHAAALEARTDAQARQDSAGVAAEAPLRNPPWTSPSERFLALGAILFGIGSIGFLVRRNILVQLMSIELMLNAVNVVLVAVNRFHPENQTGQLFAFFVIAVAAAEAAVGLADRHRALPVEELGFPAPTRTK